MAKIEIEMKKSQAIFVNIFQLSLLYPYCIIVVLKKNREDGRPDELFSWLLLFYNLPEIAWGRRASIKKENQCTNARPSVNSQQCSINNKFIFLSNIISIVYSQEWQQKQDGVFCLFNLTVSESFILNYDDMKIWMAMATHEETGKQSKLTKLYFCSGWTEHN